MFRNILVAVLIVLGSSYLGNIGFSQERSEAIDWVQGDLNEAFRQSAANGRLVYALVSTEWCGSCKHLEQEVLTVPKIAAYINKTFVPVKINGDTATEIIARYHVPGFPTTILLNSQEDELGRILGSNYPDEYFIDLQKIVTEGKTLLELKAAYASDPTNPARLAALLYKYSDMGRVLDCQMAYNELRSKFSDYFVSNRGQLSYSLAKTYYYNYRYEDAANYFHDVTISGAEDELVMDSFFKLVFCYRSLNRPFDLFRTLDEAIAAFPNVLTPYISILFHALENKDYIDHALEQGKIGLSLSGEAANRAELRYLMARAFEVNGGIEQAIQMIDEAIALNPIPEYIEYRKHLTGQN
jgi:thioredoxin 1